MQDGKYGFIDKTGKIVIPAKYDEVWNFGDGVALVVQNGKKFNIDKKGHRKGPKTPRGDM